MKYPVLFLLAAAGAAAAAVQPPPLPPGSARVRIEPGMNEAERQRQIRAHHHKGHHRKDHTRDDSLPPPTTGKPARTRK